MCLFILQTFLESPSQWRKWSTTCALFLQFLRYLLWENVILFSCTYIWTCAIYVSENTLHRSQPKGKCLWVNFYCFLRVCILQWPELSWPFVAFCTFSGVPSLRHTKLRAAKNMPFKILLLSYQKTVWQAGPANVLGMTPTIDLQPLQIILYGRHHVKRSYMICFCGTHSVCLAVMSPY